LVSIEKYEDYNHRRVPLAGLLSLALALSLAGCSEMPLATPEEMVAFEQAGTITPVLDMTRVEKAQLTTGPYRVVRGDVLEFTMAALLQAVTAAEVQAAQGGRTPVINPYLARVRDNGAIVLPAVGPMIVAGLSLSQIEERVTEAYRSYVVPHPSVFVRVAEYKMAKVYIAGAVKTPGVYTLQADQMTLSHLLTHAGGITEAGAAVVRLLRSSPARPAAARIIPVNAPSADRPIGARQDANEGAGPPNGPRGVEDPEADPSAQAAERDGSPSGLPVRNLALESLSLTPDFGLGGPSQTWTLTLGDLEAGRRPKSQNISLSPAAAIVPSGQDASGLAEADSTDLGPRGSDVLPVGAGGPEARPIVLPVVNTNIPYRDIALDEGDTVVVEPVQMPLFSVLGLVMRPGNFPYPTGAHYNLTQAIAFAGGLDPVARPFYATVYRLKEDGTIARAPFRLMKSDKFTEALGTPIRPGDVVAVEHTLRTHFNTAVHDLLRINAGIYLSGRDLGLTNY
jgi:protein involved in polysaccharide export with SLBB domain